MLANLVLPALRRMPLSESYDRSLLRGESKTGASAVNQLGYRSRARVEHA